MLNSKATPGSWEIQQAQKPVGIGKEEDCLIYGKDERGTPLHIAETFQYQNDDHGAANGTSMANAEFIVRACNSHEELLHGLKMAVGWIRNQGIKESQMPRGLKSFDELNEIIANATKGE